MLPNDASRKAEGDRVDVASRAPTSAKDQAASVEKHMEASVGLGTKPDAQKCNTVEIGDSLDVMHDKRNFANVQDAFLSEVAAELPKNHDQASCLRQTTNKCDTSSQCLLFAHQPVPGISDKIQGLHDLVLGHTINA